MKLWAVGLVSLHQCISPPTNLALGKESLGRFVDHGWAEQMDA
jgi:hypothetical protein